MDLREQRIMWYEEEPHRVHYTHTFDVRWVEMKYATTSDDSDILLICHRFFFVSLFRFQVT